MAASASEVKNCWLPRFPDLGVLEKLRFIFADFVHGMVLTEFFCLDELLTVLSVEGFVSARVFCCSAISVLCAALSPDIKFSMRCFLSSSFRKALPHPFCQSLRSPIFALPLTSMGLWVNINPNVFWTFQFFWKGKENFFFFFYVVYLCHFQSKTFNSK